MQRLQAERAGVGPARSASEGHRVLGSQEDGIIDEVWDAYAEARMILGRSKRPVNAATPDDGKEEPK
jgi:hypothetical protein